MSTSVKRQGSHEEEAKQGKKPPEALKDDDGIIDSDDDILEESIKERQSWRGEDRFSDYTIVITERKVLDEDSNVGGGDVNESDKEKSMYNVRKAILADGPRRSEYFVRLFDNSGKFSESQDNTSRIELNELQAKAFPDLLDYMYSSGHKMTFSTANATALYTLAKYFGVKRLQNEAKKFCLHDMLHVKRCGTYYEHATILQEESIMAAAKKFCRDNIGRIDVDTSRLLHVPDPQFWLDLMKDRAEKNTLSNLGYILSLHIAFFCINHAAVLSPEIFKQLTDEEYLPESHIHPVCAVILLHSELCIISNDATQQGGLSSLQVRCVNAIARGDQEGLRELHEEGIRDLLKELSPLVLYEIIFRGLLPPPRV